MFAELTVINHLLWALSNCTGCPASPENLSTTLLWILSFEPPKIEIEFPLSASVLVDANFILSTFGEVEKVMA